MEEVVHVDEESDVDRLVQSPFMDQFLSKRGPARGVRLSPAREQHAGRIAGENLEEKEVQRRDEEDGQDDVRDLPKQITAKVHGVLSASGRVSASVALPPSFRRQLDLHLLLFLLLAASG